MIAMMRAVFDRRLNPRVSEHSTTIPFGPFFNTSTQKRWRRKPASTAKTRLQDTRVKDSHFDRLSSALKKLTVVIKYHEIITGTTANIGAFSSVQIISVWKRRVGLTGKVGAFLRKYPHVFDVFPHPVRRSLCCRLTDEASNLIAEEEKAVRDSEHQIVDRLKKFLRMTVDGKVSVHTLFHVRREMGLGRDFVTSILEKYNDVFDLDVENGTVELVVAAEAEAKEEVLAAVEIWREREYREKWLSALDTEFAFPLHFPNGFKKPPGFRDTIKNWQRLPYRKPYEEKKKERRGKSRVESGSRKRYEKRAVSLIHEFLSLTVEKMVEVERLTRLRKDLGMLVNVREVLLRHPGIFYISTRGFTLRVFLRESYHRGVLLDPNPVHFARTKMLGLLMVPRHHRLQGEELAEEGRVLLEKEILASHEAERRGAKKDKDWVLPLLDTLKDT